MPNADSRCSTPFGITDYIGSPIIGYWLPDPPMCSTPFGITDYIGSSAPRGASIRQQLSAQRLSASRIISVRKFWITKPAFPLRCSTPFGITDYIGYAKD